MEKIFHRQNPSFSSPRSSKDKVALLEGLPESALVDG
jgi:hypothetical protein